MPKKRGHVNHALEAALLEVMRAGARSRTAIRIIMDRRFPSLREVVVTEHLSGLVESGRIIRKGAQKNMTFELVPQ